jgi:hypothetical protein
MPRLLQRLSRKLLCRFACHGVTVVRHDQRTGTARAIVYCKRCERILEVEEVLLPTADVRERRVARSRPREPFALPLVERYLKQFPHEGVVPQVLTRTRPQETARAKANESSSRPDLLDPAGQLAQLTRAPDLGRLAETDRCEQALCCWVSFSLPGAA